MARITEEASATVSMNMEPARRSLEEWTQSVERGKQKLKELLDVPEGKRDNKAIRDVEGGIRKAQKEVAKAEEKLKTFRDTLKNLNSASINELYSASKKLEAQIKRLKPGTKEFIAASHDLKMVKTRLNDLRDGFKAVTAETVKSRKTLKDYVGIYNHYWGSIAMTAAAITGVSSSFRKAAEEVAKLDDTYSDVMKTTGLLHEEVKDLDEELMKLNTRTSREQLLLLARDAGKLGITGRDNILGFVRAADKIQVALGEDLGEGTIRNLGKIADVLGYTKTMGIEKSLLSIGSAVNAVGRASTANEAYLVDFTQRLAGVAAQTNISAANIIGFASGLDQSAMKVEMAATAFQKFVMKLYEDPAKFAAYANMEVKAFSDLLANDANEAIITVLRNLQDKNGFAALVPIFKDMGLDGARTVGVLSAMASNLSAITEAQSLANVEFEKATSITEEFNTKNENLQAQLEKARKEFHNATISLGQILNPIMLKSTKLTTYLIKALAKYGKEIKTVVIVIAALNLALKAKAIWLKVVAVWNATLRSGSLALAAAQALLTGNITRATAAWTMMNAAMKASVFGLAVAAITGLVFALQRMGRETKKLTELQKFEKSIREDVANATSQEAAQVKALRSVLEDSNKSYSERNAALDELKKIVPEYHAQLTEESVLIDNNTKVLNDYIDAMQRKARSAVLDEKLRENAAKQLAQEQFLMENAGEGFKDVLGEWRYSYQEYTEEGYLITHMMNADCEAAMARLKEFKEEEKVILEMMNGDAGSSFSGNGTVVAWVDGEGGVGGDATKYKDALKALEAHQRNEENVLKQSYINREINEVEYNAKRNMLELQSYKERIDLARKYGEDQSDIVSKYLDLQIKLFGDNVAEMEAQVSAVSVTNPIADQGAYDSFWEKIQSKAQSFTDMANVPSLKSEYELEMQWLEKLHDRKLISEETFQKASLKLKLKYASMAADSAGQIADQASNLVTALQDSELANAEADYKAQLAAAGDNAELREKIEAEHEQKKLDIQKKYADADMAINIAKALAAGALAAIKAVAELGPVAGPIMAAVIAATTAAQVATIIAQRNAIKSTTTAGGGGASGGTPTTGQRTITGYSEGGNTTRSYSDQTPVGIVHANEWVAPAWMVRSQPVVFANLERYRLSGRYSNAGGSESGFASGGYTGVNESVLGNTPASDIEKAVYNGIRTALENGWFRGYVVRKDIQELDAQDIRLKRHTSRS